MRRDEHARGKKDIGDAGHNGEEPAKPKGVTEKYPLRGYERRGIRG